MAPFAVELDDFSGGYNVGVKLPRQPSNTWTGKDVLVTAAGLLVPRRRVAVDTGNAAGNQALTGSEEAFNCFVCQSSAGGLHFVYGYRNGTTSTLYQFARTDAGAWSYVRAHTLTNSTDPPTKFIFNRTNGTDYLRWIRYPASNTYDVVDLSAGTAQASVTLPESCQANTLAIWGSRLVAASSVNTGRIYYSDPASWGSWPSSQYIDVTAANLEAIHEIIGTASALYIGRPSGWIVLTGTPVDLNALQVRPLDQGEGFPQAIGSKAANLGGRIFYIGNKPDTFLREYLTSGVRDLAHTVEGDESVDFLRKYPDNVSAAFRLVNGGLGLDNEGTFFDSTSDGTGSHELLVFRDGKFQRHMLDSTSDGIGGDVKLADGWPGPDPLVGVHGISIRDSDNKVAPWVLPVVETRPVYWQGGAIEGVWRSAPIAGPRPAEPFKAMSVLIEVYKFKTSSEGDATGWGGSCSVKAKLWGEWAADVSVGNLAVPSTTELTWSQTASSIPDDWQREMVELNVNDMPAVYRLVIQLKIKMVAVRRVILVGAHVGLR